MHKLNDLLDIVFELERGESFHDFSSWMDIAILNWLAGTDFSTVTDLAIRFGLPEYEASRKTRRLCKMGFVVKERGITDKRITEICLSLPGKHYIEHIEKRFLSIASRERLNAGINSPEVALIDLPACACAPVWGADGNLVDLEFLSTNDALLKLYPNALLLKNVPLLSCYENPGFNDILLAYQSVAITGNPKTITFARAAGMPVYEWKVFRADSGNLLSVLCDHNEEGSFSAELPEVYSRYKKFYDSGPITFVLNIENRKILDVNKAAERFYGWKYGEFIKKSLSEITMSSPEKFTRELQLIKKHGYGILHVAHRLANGEIRNLEVHASLGTWDSIPVHFSIVIDRSTTNGDRDTAERSLAVIPEKKASLASFSTFVDEYRKEMPCLGDLFTELIPFGRIVSYLPGEHFMEFGDEQNNTGFILDGLFRKYALTPDGKDYTLSLFRAGEIIQPTFFIGLNEGNPFALEARCACRVFIVSSRFLQPMMNKDPRWYKLFYLDQCSKIIKANSRELSLLHDNASTRYRNFLEHEGDSVPYLRNYHIASYLGITSETLSRIRKKKLP